MCIFVHQRASLALQQQGGKTDTTMIKFREKQEPQIANYDVELISLVKEHQFLYDTKNADYRNLPLREQVWIAISANLSIVESKLSIV